MFIVFNVLVSISFYVPFPHMTYTMDSCPIHKSPSFFSWAGHKVRLWYIKWIPPTLCPALPEKSAKIWICQQLKLSVHASSTVDTYGESLMWRWRRFKMVGTWSQWDIKLPMYHWFWKFGRLFFVFGQIRFSGYFEGASTFLTPKLSLAALWTIYGSKKSWLPQDTTWTVICPQKKKIYPIFLKSVVH